MALARNVLFASLSAGSSVLLLVLLLLAAKLLGTEAFGRFSFVLALSVIFETLMDFGLKEVTTRTVARDPRHAVPHVRNTFGMKAVLGILAVLLLAATTGVLRQDTELVQAAVSLGLGGVLRSYMTTLRSIFYAIDRFDLETTVLVSDRLLVLIAGAGVLIGGYGVVALSGAFLLARIAGLALAATLASRVVGELRPSFDLPFWRDLQMRAIPFGAFVVVLQLYNYVDTVMLGVMRGDIETGLYNAAYRLYEGFAHIPSIISVVLTPRLAREFVSDRGAYRRTAAWGIGAAAALGIPAGLLAYLIAPPAVALLYDQSYAPSAGVLQLLGLGFVVVFPLAVLHTIAMAANAERLMLLTAVVGCAANASLNLLLIPGYGMNGAAFATIIGEAISLAVLGAGMWMRRCRPAPVSGSREEPAPRASP
jgi:O-antigen/teichoic acid export membrane protein